MQTKAKLLFVDDEERVVNLLRMMFRSMYEVHTATSGDKALEIIAAHRIDVIVSDQRMPGMLGIELLAEVRKRSPATMRILLTGYSDLTAIVGSVNDGEVFRFMSKPWDHDEVMGIIAEAVEAARATAAIFASEHEPSVTPSQTHSTLESGLLDGDAPPAVLLIDDNEADRQAIAKVISGKFTVYGAGSIPEALKILEQTDVGVIVSEARVSGSDAGELLRILKQHYPAITTVMLTSSADSDLVIKLINGAQIFRFAPKPVRAGVFLLAVTAAMREHYRFRANPALAKRHKVAASAEPENFSLMASVVKSLGGFRARLAARLARFAH